MRCFKFMGGRLSCRQILKFGFLFLLWLETKLSVENGPSTLVGFIDWVRCK